MKKKLLASLLAISLFVGLATPTFAERTANIDIRFGFTDVERRDWNNLLGTAAGRELGVDHYYSGYSTQGGYDFSVSGSAISGRTTASKLDSASEGSKAPFVTYARIIGLRYGVDFNRIVFNYNGNKTQMSYNSNSGVWAVRDNDTYVRWDNYFATNDSTGWYRHSDTYQQDISLYSDDYLIATHSYTIDMTKVTYPASSSYRPPNNNSSVINATVHVPYEVTNVTNPQLFVTELPAWSEELKDFTSIVGNFAILRTYDIDLYDNSYPVTNVVGGRVRIDIPFGGIPGQEYMMLRYNNDRTITQIPASYYDNIISFETNHFTTYAIAVRSTTAAPPTQMPPVVTPPVTTTPPPTGVDTPIWALSSLLLFACGLIIFRRKLCK